ncbi:Dynactin subunit 6 [Botryosphaeria dothidea]|uniref:Dynactin subunit 6 n=1 Tax=Botryosphaeria dothidea TaxID=55169 RepID=A0A8H4J4T7_9PEZI|nr:Dynactin subunit 6 [Botryosphaeria dothidea]
MPPKRAQTRKSRRRQAAQQQTQQQTQNQVTPAVTATLISQKQSQELAQSLLLGSLSAILCSRDLIGETSFKWIQFDVDADGPWSYDIWKAGAMEVHGDDRTQSMIILQNNGSYKAKAFMEYIENGAFHAIENGYLRAFQLRIFEDPDHPENVLETYTLAFSYHRLVGTDGRVVSGVEVTGPGGKRASLNNLRIGLTEFMQNLVEFLDKLPDLPGMLSLRVGANRETDGVVQKNGISSPNSSIQMSVRQPIRLLDSKKAQRLFSTFLEKRASIIGLISQATTKEDITGLVNLTVDHLRWYDARNDPIPSGLHYPGHLALTTRPNSRKRPSSNPTSSPAAPSKSPRTNGNTIHDKLASEQERVETPATGPETLGTSQDTTNLERQVSKPTVEDTQRVISNGASSQVILVNAKDSAKIKLHQTTVDALNERRLFEAYGSDYEHENNTPDSEKGKEDRITCQCGWHGEEDDNMICCDWCKTWQHCYCYGFRGASDPRVPQQHACYKCLLTGEDNEARQTLQKLKSFALLRRGIQVIEEKGFYDKASFASALGVGDRQTASDTFDMILSNDVLVASPGSKKKGFSQTGRPRYQVVDKEPGRSKMMEKFFDPLFKIKHYYVPGRSEHEEASSGALHLSASRSSTSRTSTSGTGKRASSSLPKAPATIHPSAIVANHAVLTGHHAITIAAGAVIHPNARVTSLHGPVVIGEGCIVYEKATVGIPELEGGQGRGVVLDKNVVVESSAIVQAALVGEGTTIGADVKVGLGSAVGKFCQLAPRTELLAHSDLPDYTVVYSSNLRRLNYSLRTRPAVMELLKRAHEKKLHALTRLIPNNAAKWQ